MTSSAVAKLVVGQECWVRAEFNEADKDWIEVVFDSATGHQFLSMRHKDVLPALATAPPEQAAWRIKCPNCGVTQSHDCKTLGERMGDGAPAQFLQNIENILGRCVFDQPDSLTYDEGVAAVKALPELAGQPQPASDGALEKPNE